MTNSPKSLLAAALLTGCAGARAMERPPESPVPSQPLAAFATLRMIILPVQHLRGGETLGWSTTAGDPKRYLATVDQALEASFRERGLGSNWAFPTDLTRTARRNPTFAVDPAAIRAGDAVRVMERRRDAEVPEPVASQLRAMVGFHDARYALVPVELWFEANSSGAGGRAALHVAVMDVIGSRLVWVGDVGGEMVLDLAAAAPSLARRFADVVVAR